MIADPTVKSKILINDGYTPYFLKGHNMRTSSIRFFNLKQLPKTEKNANPRLIPCFFSEKKLTELLALLHNWNQNLIDQAKDKSFVLSKTHNLQSEEKYQKVNNCQYFPTYDEEGHALTYFSGNKNIPEFIKKEVIAPLQGLDEVKALKHKKQKLELDHCVTYNVYDKTESAPGFIAGFPFHTDIKSNGELTLICSLTSMAILELQEKEETNPSYSGVLTPGSVFALHYAYLNRHRVAPSKTLVPRHSLVIGCQ